MRPSDSSTNENPLLAPVVAASHWIINENEPVKQFNGISYQRARRGKETKYIGWASGAIYIASTLTELAREVSRETLQRP